MAGIQYAGPDLTVKTFRQGLFSVPAQGGAASDLPNSFQTGYGKTVGLPYDEYLALGTDFAPVWWDSETPDAYSQIFLSQAKGGEWYVDGAKRYKAGDLADQADDVLRQDDRDPGVPDVADPRLPTQPVHRMSEHGAPGTPGARVSD